MKKLLLLTLPLLIVSFVFTGCSKDDGDEGIAFDQSTVIGTWTVTSINGTSPWSWIATGNTLVFNSDGSCSTGLGMENSWKLEGGKIKTYYRQTSEPMLIYTLLSKDGTDYTVKVGGTLDEKDLSVVIKMKK